MKKLLMCLLAIVGLCANAQEKNAGCYLRLVEPAISDTLSAQNEVIKVSFDFWPTNIFVDLKIENRTDSVMEIDWDKFLYLSGKNTLEIVFDDTVMALANAPKGKSRIAPHSYIRKKIAPKDHIEYATPLYQKKYVKKYGPAKMTFIFPIEVSGNYSEFKCAIEAYTK